MTSLVTVAAIVLVSAIAHQLWQRSRRRREREVDALAKDLASLGELVPDSLHPHVDPDHCMGSGACVLACPEHDVIALRNGRAELVNPLACVGHGACAAACPVGAIKLVFGTATRGVELPALDPEFQTSLPGVWIVGELGGMGLIRNAVRQGAQAARAIARSGRRGRAGVPDVVVVGAGPAGIAAALGAREAKLAVTILEASDFGGTIAHYPRAKVVMSGRLDLPLYGKVARRTMSKEQLLELWADVRSKTGLEVETGVTVEQLVPAEDGTWILETTRGQKRAASVVLALGRRGAPRKLGVPGEDLAKVAYRLLEPEPFRGRHVMVVGGGNSAVESALALADDGGCASVSLSYRRGELARVRRQNRLRIDDAIRSGKVRALMPSEIVEIEPGHVRFTAGKQESRVENDAVIVQIGGTAPSELLAKFGIQLVTKHGEA